MKEEQERLDGIPGVHPTEFTFFTHIRENDNVREAYDTMQSQYVLLDQDRIEFKLATEAMLKIKAELSKNPAWMGY